MTDEEEIYFTQQLPFEFERTADGKLIVSGWSVHTGKFQGGTVEIPASELRNIAETLVGKQIRKDHKTDTDSIVGQVLETKIGLDKDIRKKGVRFKGVIRDQVLEQKITDGFIDNNSIGFKLQPECSKCGEDFRFCEHRFGEAHVIARDCNCFEQSFVPIGADQDTSIEPGAAFSGEVDFIAQFSADKWEEEEMTVETTQTGQNTTTSDSSTYTTSQTYTFEPVKYELPPININVTTAGEEKFSDEPTEDGDKMEDLEKLQAKFDEQTEELEKVKSEKNDLSVQVTELEAEKVELEGQITTLEQEKADVTTELQTYKDAEVEAVRLAKETLCNEIVTLRIEKGLLEEEDKEAKLAEVSELDDKALEQMKEILVAMSDKPEAREEPAVGEFHNTEDGDKPMPEASTGEFDLDDEKTKENMHRAMFGLGPKE